MEPWRRRWLDRYISREAFEWKVLGVCILFIGIFAAVQEGEWLGLPLGVLGAWLCVLAGEAWASFMRDAVQQRDSED